MGSASSGTASAVDRDGPWPTDHDRLAEYTDDLGRFAASLVGSTDAADVVSTVFLRVLGSRLG